MSARGAITTATLFGLFLALPAFAGGGVMVRNERCVISVGFYEAHFTAYQPQTRGDEEFCENLPDTGETLFVLDYLHESLKEVPLEFLIIRDPTELGQFFRLEDIQGLDLDALTVFHAQPRVEPGGSYQVSHRFDQAGHYVGIVTAGHPTKDKTYTAVFPFTAGFGGFPLGWVLAVAGLVAVAAALFIKLRSRPSPGSAEG